MHPFARVALAAPLASLVSAQTTTVESANGQGAVANGFSREASSSADGRWIAFVTSASNLASIDTNASDDAYVRDRQDGSVELISVSFSGGPSNGGVQTAIDLSPDGRFVAFASLSGNLVAIDGNGHGDVFLRDRERGTTELLSLAPGDVQGNHSSYDARLSDDGRMIAFTSFASNLVANDTNAAADVYVRDRAFGATLRVSVGSAGAPSITTSQWPVISGDGRYVAFYGWDDLTSGDSNGSFDVLVRDLVLETTTLANVSSGGAVGNLGSKPGGLSFDGRWLAFASFASNLVAGDVNGVQDVFVRDLELGTTELVSLSSLGAPGDQVSDMSAIASDGRWVAFTSSATNFVAGDTNASPDVFLRDRVSATTVRASVGPNGEQSNAPCLLGDVSADGRYVAFWTVGNLVPADLNLAGDVHLRDFGYVGAQPTTYCVAKVNSQGCSPKILAMGQPRASGFDSFFLIGRIALVDKNGLLFWGRSAASLPFGGGTLCVQPPLVRTPIQTSTGASGCSGAFWFHFAQSYMASENVLAGDTIYGQYWYRDPGYAPPNNVGLSDAIEVTAVP